MMKKLTMLLLVLIVVFAAAGCKKEEKNSGDSQVSTEPQTTLPETVPMIIPDKQVIDTLYYTLDLPGYWADHEFHEIQQRETGGYIFTVKEKSCHMDFGGGALFSLWVVPQGEDYSYLPDYTVLGVLEENGSGYDVLVTYPTDVQFSEDTARLYQAMYAEIPDILRSFAPKVEFYPFIPNNE